MSEPERDETDGAAEDPLPSGIDEPGSDEPEADALEQQLPPESGAEGDQVDVHREGPMQGEFPGVTSGARDADVVEQERAVEPEEDDYRE